jgi:hypothetical protein
MMGTIGKLAGIAVGGACLALSAGAASAAEAVSGDVGYTYNSHFVSYGLDVWGAGSGFYGKQATSSIYGDLAVKATDALTFTLNVWSDINNNVPSAIGGNLQEVDINTGVSYAIGKFTTGITYGSWNYAGDAEEVIDTSIGFNDADLLMPGFALNPKVVWHYRTAGNGAQQVGSALVFSVAPSFGLGDGLSLTLPAGISFFTTDDFQGGVNASGYGFSYLGGSLAYSLGFIPAAYGAWTVNFDLIAYFTKKKAIPGNVKEDFLTGSMGVKVAF